MIARLMNPGTIAVVGASADARKLRGKLLHTLRAGGFPGRIHPVNPGHAEIQGLRAWPSVAAIPETVDLVLVAVPGAQVGGVLDEAAAAGAGAAIVFSSGVPAEALRPRVGLRLLGSNTEGMYLPQHGLAATFSQVVEETVAQPPPARDAARAISIVSQSGGLGFAMLGHGLRQHLDFRAVITTGNEDDLDCLDFVEYLLGDGQAGPILMFIEGLKRPRRFAEVAAMAATRGVPLVVMKIGRSEAGRRAAISHTAHLTGADAAYDAQFERYGVLRVSDQEEMLAAAAAFSRLPPAAGRRTVIVSTSGGAGAWAAELCSAHGLEVPALSAPLCDDLKALLPSFASAANPVDVTAAAVEDGGAAMMKVLQRLAASDEADSVIVNMGLARPGRVAGLSEVLAPLIRASRPILFHSHIAPVDDNLAALAALGGHGFHSFRACAYALHALAYRAAFLERWRAGAPLAADAASTLPTDALPQGAGLLSEVASQAVLQRFGIPVPPGALAGSAEEALAAARRLGFPVVLKVQSPDIPHKTEAGAVALRVTEAELTATHGRILADALRAVPGARIEGVLVQRMMPPGREVIIGVTDDPDFGPLVMLGLGGIFTEVLKDVAFAPAPLDRAEALRLIRSLRGSAVLLGVRGQPEADLDGLAALLVAVGDLAAAGAGRIDQIDLNPVMVYSRGEGVVALDALIALKG